MAKDDYHVIVYQILSYLYQCLKKGEPIDGDKLNYGSELLRINRSYWAYVIYNMHRMGLIEGIVFCRYRRTGNTLCHDAGEYKNHTGGN